MTVWTETEVTLPFMMAHAKARTNGEIWQIRTETSIGLPDERLDSYIDELAEIKERLADATIRFIEGNDDFSAEIRIIGWREVQENEKACLPSS